MALVYDGHSFGTVNQCLCCDASPRLVVDPTNTHKLRSRFKQDFTQRWSRLRIAARDIIMKQDVLAIRSGGLMNIAAPGIVNSATKTEVWQRWFDNALDKLVVGGDGSWMRPYLSAAFDEGTKFGQLQAKTVVTHQYAGHRSDALQVLARVELQGIGQAVSQQATRAVANGLLTQQSPMAIVRAVQAAIDKIGRIRSEAMVEMLVVRAHSEASLDVYEAEGIATVGLLPEAVAVQRLGAKDAARKQTKKAGKTVSPSHAAGSRSRGKSGGPGLRTQQRIRRAELNIARRLGENVNVKTAGDDRVCPICEGISENGPYTINRARTLIPAHPRCRCVFVPVASSRRIRRDAGVSLESA
jgi:hypothetical protein